MTSTALARPYPGRHRPDPGDGAHEGATVWRSVLRLTTGEIEDEAMTNAVTERVCLNCEDWDPNIGKLTGPAVSWSAATGRTAYDGKPFKFCPRCGTHLSDVGPDTPPAGVHAP
jgi:hypothetical protein